MQSIFQVTGKVISGAKRGKRLGFPTANLKLDQKIPEGIYASQVIKGANKYKAATFVGTPKTFGEKDYKLETYLLNFDGDLYDEEITVYLYKKIRNNKKFQSATGLYEQIKKDVEDIRKYFREQD